MIRKTFAAAAALLASTGVLAQSDSFLSRLYVAGTLGYAQNGIDTGSISQQVQDLGFKNVNTSSDDGQFAWRITGGWQPLKNLAFEVSYFDLGKPGYTVTAQQAGALDASIKVSGWSVDLVPQYEFNDQWGIFARGGYAWSESKASFTGTGNFELLQNSVKETNNGWDAGVGVSYRINKNIALRAEWTYYPDLGGEAMGGNFNANFYSLSAVWRF